jgi:hypothetical protein
MGGRHARDDTWTASNKGGMDIIIWLVLAVLVVYMISRVKM